MTTTDPTTPPRRRSTTPPPPTLAPSPFVGSTPAIAFTKTLSTLYLAGFSFLKIHVLLPAIFPTSPLLSEPLYALPSLSTTCSHLQHRDRSNPRSNPYLAVVASCPSPLHTRRLANDIFEKHFPAEAAQATEKDELAEMRVWHARWKEEVRLCRDSEFSDFNDRAVKFAKVLDDVERWLVKENVPVSGWGSLIRSGLRTVSMSPVTLLRRVSTRSSRSRSRSQSPTSPSSPPPSSRAEIHTNLHLQPESSSPKRSRPTTPVPSATATATTTAGAGGLMAGSCGQQLKPQQLPKLDTRAMAAAMGAHARGRQEGTATPGRAQMLDPEGFFSPRPKTPSPTPSQRDRKGSSAGMTSSSRKGSA